MRVLVVFVVVLLLSGCSKPKLATVDRTVENTFTLATVCPDKEELYKDSEGNLMHWNVGASGGYFVKLDKSLTAEAYCLSHQLYSETDTE